MEKKGVNLINKLVLDMGYVFRPTGTLDAGIDGEIEIRNQRTSEVTNQIIKVQSKAVSKFEAETELGFDYWPSDEDVKYWLGGNVPVILVVSRPATDEAYWVSVQQYKAKVGTKVKKIHLTNSKTAWIDRQRKGCKPGQGFEDWNIFHHPPSSTSTWCRIYYR